MNGNYYIHKVWLLVIIMTICMFTTGWSIKRKPDAPMTFKVLNIKLVHVTESYGIIFIAHQSVPYYFVTVERDDNVRIIKLHKRQVTITISDDNILTLEAGYLCADDECCGYCGRWSLAISEEFVSNL